MTTTLDKDIAPPAIGRFWQAVKIALLLGALSVAAVAAIASPRIECPGALLSDPSVSNMVTDPDGTGLLISPLRQCRIVFSVGVSPKATPWITIPASVARYLPLPN